MTQTASDCLSNAERYLIDLSNDLGRENALLHNDLTEMTLSFNWSEKHVKSLQTDLGVATRSNGYLRECNNKLDQDLDATLKTNKYLRNKVASQKWYIGILEKSRRTAFRASQRK